MLRPENRFIYARPSWQEGIARLLDFGGALDVYKPVRREVNGTSALAQAWQIIGRTLQQTMKSEVPRHDS